MGKKEKTTEYVERVTVVWQGQEVQFKKIWGGHEFTEEEIEQLAQDKEISFESTTKRGSKCVITGKLQEQEYNGHEYVGFKNDPDKTVYQKDPAYIYGEWNGREIRFKKEFSGHAFTEDEVNELLAGEEISFEAKSKRTGKQYVAVGKLEEQEYNGHTFVGFKLNDFD